jgi:Beta protein
MDFDNEHYVPCLRWKLGEYQALLRSSSHTKGSITPLIEIAEIGWDFEDQMNSKTMDEHLKKVAKRIEQKWGKSPCFVDLRLLDKNERMANGHHPVKFVFDGLRGHGCYAVPVVGMDSDKAYRRAVRDVSRLDSAGVCLRLELEVMARKNLKATLDSLLKELHANVTSLDLVVDLGAPSFCPLTGLSKAVLAAIKRLPYLNQWRTFTLIGTSFPASMGSVKQNTQLLDRSEWLLYKVLIPDLKKARLRLPTFGDYAINHPSVPKLDMRMVKPAATIRYTTDDAWFIVKGSNVRGEKGFGQYKTHCETLLNSGVYLGAGFSEGDKYIEHCASGGSTGNLTTWRWVGTNHHIVKVIRDVASFYGSSSTP